MNRCWSGRNWKLVKDQAAELSHLERAALLNFAQSIEFAPSDQRQAAAHDARALGPLAGERPRFAVIAGGPLSAPEMGRSRFARGLLPAVSLIVGWFFWIYFNPPTGPSVPNMAVTFGLMAVMTPMNVLRLIPIVFIALWAFVAPVYFLVMPRLSTGPELLALIFVFAFTRSIGACWSVDGAPIGHAAGIRHDDRNQQQSKLLIRGDCQWSPDASAGLGHCWHRSVADRFDEIRTGDARTVFAGSFVVVRESRVAMHGMVLPIVPGRKSAENDTLNRWSCRHPRRVQAEKQTTRLQTVS